ncbi:hypothetical protein AB6A40_008541 [Gnathostoma spinigerum]|uniref:Uncharacterized protein n=1 Tax=Gnathostoma spinigerum TaxID=75299 RepID=A0ABD6EZ03_9BILA
MVADVCHAYHVLIEHGIPANQIITMMVDDIANHKNNPFHGKIFNEPNGTDVYGNVRIDYKGDRVTAENFLAILSGRTGDLKGGKGPVIESTQNDSIFVYFSGDRGTRGIINFPDGSVLTAKRLNDKLKEMHSEKRYAKLVFYLQSSYSGSVFRNFLPENISDRRY